MIGCHLNLGDQLARIAWFAGLRQVGHVAFVLLLLLAPKGSFQVIAGLQTLGTDLFVFLGPHLLAFQVKIITEKALENLKAGF